MCQVMLYNICRVMLFNVKYFMLYNIFYVMLYNICYVILFNIKCYDIRTLEKLVNHSPSARDLQAFLVFSQHPAWVITPVNP